MSVLWGFCGVLQAVRIARGQEASLVAPALCAKPMRNGLATHIFGCEDEGRATRPGSTLDANSCIIDPDPSGETILEG